MSTKIKQFELEYVEDIPVVIENIPGISDLALDYSSSIGGAEKPADGADVTGDNVSAGFTGQGDLATLDQVNTAEIVNGAVEKVKMALLSVDADILAASAVTTVKIDDDAITSPKILAGAVIAGKIAADAVTANEIDVSTLSAISANIGTVTAGNINGLTITGGTIQTATSGKRVVLSSSDDQITLYTDYTGTNLGGTIFGYNFGSIGQGVGIDGEDIIGFQIDGTVIGYINSTGMSLGGYDFECDDIECDNITCDIITADNVNTYNIKPRTTNIYSLGDSTYQWFNVRSRYMQVERSITIEPTTTPNSDDGTIFYDSTNLHFYGRVNGAWKQLDN